MRPQFFRRSVVLVMLFCALAAAALDVPKRDPRKLLVQDNTGTLTESQVQQLHTKLKNLNDTDGTQIMVLVMPTLDGDDVFDFAQRTAVAWGIGQKDNDNGVLFLLVKDDRKIRIHTGRGVEHLIPDITAQQIITREVRPHLREGRYFEGINAAVDSMIKAVRGQYTAPAAAARSTQTSSGAGFWLFLFLFVGVWWWMSRQARKAALRNRRRHGRGLPGVVVFPDVWGTGGHFPSGGGGGWGGGGGGGVDFGGGDFGGGGASGDW